MDVAMLRSTAKFLVAEAGVLALPPTFLIENTSIMLSSPTSPFDSTAVLHVHGISA